MHKKNFTLYQIAAGALALFLWIFVALSQNPTIEKIYTLPVEFSGMNEDFVLLESDFHVQVRLSGMEFAFENLQTVNMKAHVDLFDLPAGKHNVNVNLSFPDNLQLVSCTPDKISIELEEKKTKPFNVSVEIGTPTLPAGYNVMSPIASPSLVYITGADKYLSQVDKVFVGLNISGLSETYKQSLPVQVMDTQGNIITSNFTITPSAVDVIVPIVADLPEKSVAVAVDYVGQPAEDYILSRIVVEPSTVNVYGEIDVLNNLLSVATEQVDITGATADIIQTVDLTEADGVTFGNTDKVTVIMQIMHLETMTFNNIPVSILNSNPEDTVEVNGNIKVAVKGLATSLAKFNSSNLIATVDVNYLKPGEYNLPVDVRFRNSQSSDLTILYSLPENVRVTVTAPVTEVPVSPEQTDVPEPQNDALAEENAQNENVKHTNSGNKR